LSISKRPSAVGWARLQRGACVDSVRHWQEDDDRTSENDRKVLASSAMDRVGFHEDQKKSGWWFQSDTSVTEGLLFVFHPPWGGHLDPDPTGRMRPSWRLKKQDGFTSVSFFLKTTPAPHTLLGTSVWNRPPHALSHSRSIRKKYGRKGEARMTLDWIGSFDRSERRVVDTRPSDDPARPHRPFKVGSK
jgi:hypothetical protein